MQGHKVILSACSPYFKKILKDNPCRHPVLILNDIELEVLDALMTYMYNGTVSVPHNKLQTFLKTAEALKIKGIVDTGPCDDSAGSDSGSASPAPAPAPALLPAQVQELLSVPLLHPAGDLSLLASAASQQQQVADGGGSAPGGHSQNQHNNKRRKTAPRKLGSYLLNNSSHINRAPHSPAPARAAAAGSDEENGGQSGDRDTEKENNRMVLQMIKDRDTNGCSLKEGFLLSNTNGKASAMNLTKHFITSGPIKQEKDESLDLTVKTLLTPGAGDTPQSPSPPSSTTSQLQLLSSSILPASGGSPLNLLVIESLLSPPTPNTCPLLAECGRLERR